jgi:formylglycine-generating enzyme required for sulfatase activity
MLGGVATSLLVSRGVQGPRVGGPADDVVAVTGKSTETLPRLLDPAASLTPTRPAPPRDPWLLRGPAPLAENPKLQPDPGPPAALAEHREVAAGKCPEGMILVEGDYCPVLGHVCLKELDGEVERCAQYAAPPICEGSVQKKRFCIDRFEYPNLEGVRPAVMVSWHEAQDACEAEGKRLCTGSEWTLACEGSERVPYPYGYTRDASACNIDRPHADVDVAALENPRMVASEVARLDQRVPSGQMTRCKSSYGVQDMTGNVDEWVVNEKHFAPPARGVTSGRSASARRDTNFPTNTPPATGSATGGTGSSLEDSTADGRSSPADAEAGSTGPALAEAAAPSGSAPAGAGERPFISALKGGYWGPVRNRCRATTTAHNEWFRYYEVGFRCCADAPRRPAADLTDRR